MKYIKTEIPEVIEFIPEIFEDDRGFFLESFNKEYFDKIIGSEVSFVQDNHSFSKKNVLRGIHYQINPMAQGKLVRVIDGEIYDIAVDLRKSSPSFGKWVSRNLSSSKNNQLWIPAGFGHGFYTVSESVHLLYKTTNYFDRQCEASIIWDDKDLNIDWGHSNPILSSKDSTASSFKNAVTFD